MLTKSSKQDHNRNLVPKPPKEYTALLKFLCRISHKCDFEWLPVCCHAGWFGCLDHRPYWCIEHVDERWNSKCEERKWWTTFGGKCERRCSEKSPRFSLARDEISLAILHETTLENIQLLINLIYFLFPYVTEHIATIYWRRFGGKMEKPNGHNGGFSIMISVQQMLNCMGRRTSSLALLNANPDSNNWRFNCHSLCHKTSPLLSIRQRWWLSLLGVLESHVVKLAQSRFCDRAKLNMWKRLLKLTPVAFSTK